MGKWREVAGDLPSSSSASASMMTHERTFTKPTAGPSFWVRKLNSISVRRRRACSAKEGGGGAYV